MKHERFLAELEAARRQRLKPATFDLAKHSQDFPKQLAFTSSKAKYRTASCSRRSGKSEGAAAVLLEPVLSKAGCVALYLTKTRINAKRIIWGILKRLNRVYQLGGNPKEAELCMEFPNGSAIYLGGVNNKDEIDKFRGLPIAVVVIDESQMITGYLQELVDEVLEAALMDHDGCVVLLGTPAPVSAGYFYDCIQNPEWEHYDWTVFDNPWIERKSKKTPQQHLEAALKRRGVTVDDPAIQREFFGRWVYDPNSLVIRYDAALNDYEELPTLPGEWNHVVCGDIGWDDADALGVLAWNSTDPRLWLVHEDVMPKQTITALGDKLKALEAKYNPRSIILDFGGLGKKIAEELRMRWGLPVKPADKARKLEHIELLNDALRTAVLKAKKSTQFAQDAMLLEWDKSNPEKPVISDRFHSDAADMVLYGYVECHQWLFEPAPPPKPKPGTHEWLVAAQKQAQDAIESQLEREADEVEARKRQELEEQWQDVGRPWME